MLHWLLRKKKTSGPDRPAAASTGAGGVAPEPAPAQPPDRGAWQGRLEAARGDESSLLDFAQQVPLLDLKLAAVEALFSEAALRQAERAFRTHDRKVHQRVRQRLAAMVARREAQAAADAVIAAAQALLGATPIAANRLAELDRDWAALAADLLEAAQRDAFVVLRARLDDALRAQDEAARAAQWSALAAPALAELLDACAPAAGTADAARIERCSAALQLRLEACPAGALDSALAQSIRAALDAARDAVQAAARAAAQAAAEAEAQAAAGAARAALATPSSSETAPAIKPAVEAAPAAAQRDEGLASVQGLLRQGEAALAEGGSAELDRLLHAIDAELAARPGRSLPARTRARLQSLHAERQRLKGWQRWGGAVAREGLVEEAEALARATAAAQAGAPAAKLDLKAHGEAIRKLRARWKELDRTGAAAGQALWLRFDAALTLAHAPVAVQQAALKAAREQNLAAREALLATLEAADVRAEAPRAALQDLLDFQAAWRKLGPLAHTVPAAAIAALQQRLDAATGRIEAPLAEARAAAQRGRETLVERAEALVALNERDASLRLRELQSEWQQHARALPLPRAVEAALWARFRQACDAVAARREAALQARDAEAAAGIAAREVLLQRLSTLAQDAALVPTGMARALAQIDREWRDLYTPLPRATAESLEARYRDLRAAAAQSAEARLQAQWQSQCDALAERLALCEQREAAGAADAGADARVQRWQAAAPAPASWQRVLDARWSGTVPAAVRGADDAETLLLRLEDALAVAPGAEQAQARREFKLRALKDALEGRVAAPQATAEPRRHAAWFAALLARADLAAAQRERLRALIGAMRTAPQKFDAG